MDADRPHRPAEGIAALFDRTDRVRVEIGGPDRAKFLHNLTTNEVKRLPAGRGCEAFVTSPQGKTIGYVILHALDDRILVRSDPGGLELTMPHFRKYGIFDDVAIDDRSASTFEIHLVGGGADDLLRRTGADLPDGPDDSHVATRVADRPVRVIRESPSGSPGLTVIGDREDAGAVLMALRAAAGDGVLAEPDAAAFEALRIEAGTPAFGQDVTEKNLPQEFLRDDRAISFVKGCYLGQETVARIDALGHVNQVLKGLVFEPEAGCPAAGTALEADGKRVGVVTSSASSPWRGHAVALAMIRTTHAAAGTSLRLPGPEEAARPVATVVDLPFPPRS